MEWLRQLSRKRDAWVERKRRFQKFFAEDKRESAAGDVPKADGETIPDAGIRGSDRTAK